MFAIFCNRLQYLQGILSTWPKMAKVQKDWGLLLLAHRSSFRGIGHWEVQHLLLPFGLGKSGMSGSLSEIIAALQLKGTQIIFTLVRACSSKAQLIMVYWFMAPSCMAQASFCVLLGCMPRSTHKFKGRNFWLDTTFSRLLSDSPNKFLKLGTRALPQLRTWHIPRNRGVEPQLPVGSVEAPGSNTKSGLEGYWGEPGHRITETNRKFKKKNTQIFHNVGLYEVRSCSWPTLDTLLQLYSKELNICHAAIWLLLILTSLMLWSDTQHMSPPSCMRQFHTPRKRKLSGAPSSSRWLLILCKPPPWVTYSDIGTNWIHSMWHTICVLMCVQTKSNKISTCPSLQQLLIQGWLNKCLEKARAQQHPTCKWPLSKSVSTKSPGSAGSRKCLQASTSRTQPTVLKGL